MRVLCAMGVIAVAVVACRPSAAFICASDAQCQDAEGDGRCEADGFCSVPDAACDSGHRYSELSGSQLSGQCVPVLGTGSGSSAGPGSSTGIGSTTAASSSDGPSVDATGDSSSETSGATTSSSTSSGGTGGDSTGVEESSDSTTGVPVDPDLVAWYRFDALVDNVVVDSTLGGHDATCEDCPDEVNGVVGGAMQFDGATQYFVVPYDPAFDLQDRTLCAWIWLDSEPTEFLTVAGKPVGMANGNSWELGVNLGMMGPRVVSGWTNGMDYQGLAATLPGIQDWVFVASTIDEETTRLYIGETLVDEEPLTVSSAFDDSEVLIGADFDNQMIENFFHGRIDDLRIYSRALSAEELAVVMQGKP